MKSLLFLFMVSTIYSLAQGQSSPEDAIRTLIIDSYIEGLINAKDFEAAREGMHEQFSIIGRKDSTLSYKSLDKWIEQRSNRQGLAMVSYQIEYIDIEGHAANAKLRLKRGDMVAVDYLFLYRFEEGWKIVSAIDDVQKVD